jgi:hypothetical protein
LPDDEDVVAIQMIRSTFINNMPISINGREIFNSNSLMGSASLKLMLIFYLPIFLFA